MEDRDLIVTTLNWRGSCNRVLSTESRERCWLAADGYGDMTREQLEELELFEDWSHVRDCSEAGQARVAAQIRRELGDHLAKVEEVVGVLGTLTPVDKMLRIV